jgi:hypothetical protein
MSNAIGVARRRIGEREQLLEGPRLTLRRKPFYNRGWR